jgi:hypothetical protein
MICPNDICPSERNQLAHAQSVAEAKAQHGLVALAPSVARCGGNDLAQLGLCHVFSPKDCPEITGLFLTLLHGISL